MREVDEVTQLIVQNQQLEKIIVLSYFGDNEISCWASENLDVEYF